MSTHGDHCSSTLPGTYVFYSPTRDLKNIKHVAIMVNPFQIIEAGGGDRMVLTRGDAAAKGAMVRFRLLSDRQKEIVARIRPNFSRVGMI